ncbi:hypothetical protein ACTTAM_00080 [Rhodobacter capsulatus]|uniref:hypothetical protein n=1 Tax=Rhodobacter capsulatus TaxID=1061 RepID=UPI004025A82E
MSAAGVGVPAATGALSASVSVGMVASAALTRDSASEAFVAGTLAVAAATAAAVSAAGRAAAGARISAAATVCTVTVPSCGLGATACAGWVLSLTCSAICPAPGPDISVTGRVLG